MSRTRQGAGWVEVGALACLIGSMVLALLPRLSVPLLFLGIALLFASRRWTPLDKATGSVAYVLLGMPFVLLVVFVVGVEADVCDVSCSTSGTSLTVHAAVPVWLVGQTCMLLHLVRRMSAAPRRPALDIA